jgi:hypothetical protein
MTPSFSTVRILDLPGGSLVPFTSSPGERVRIVHGRIWLTEEGIARDAFLASGDEVSLDSRGLAVVEALGPARIQLIDPARVPSRLQRAAADLMRRAGAWLRQWGSRSPRPARGAV